MKERLLKIVGNLNSKSIMVIGDLMLDKYIWGDVSRISPEAPVQVVSVEKENYVPGGAANVANNIAGLGSKASMVGIVGNDISKDYLISELKKRNINVDGIMIDEKRPTIQKVRIIARSQQLLRVDYENKDRLHDHIEKKLIKFISENLQNVDGVVVSDYAKGAVTKGLMSILKDLARKHNKTIIVDPKPRNKELYTDVTLITPNHKEASEMAGIEEETEKDIEKIGAILLKTLNNNVLITRGEKGMSLFEKNGRITNIPTKAKEVFDVTGAGDTCVATIALALATGATMEEAAIIANHAAGIKVGKIGTATVSIDELRESIQNDH